jgi:UDP-N-acetylglucosamine--N-acetylmuramyl-(pentapeptide) pyrophosphoryl-undecaprenol N-acetylglucosamine transferase
VDRLKIALAASGGGHLRQLTDVAPWLEGSDVFFVTEPTALGRSLEERYRVRYFDHFAFGQQKTESIGAMIASGWRNAASALKIVMEEKPDVVISTGAGSAWFFMFWARLFGARFTLIESFARVDGPSLFGRLSRPFADFTVVQWPNMTQAYPKATLANPLRVVPANDETRRKRLLVTVGATLPFDRMVETVAQLKSDGRISHDIVAQVGVGGVRPDGVECVDEVSLSEMRHLLADSDIAVCHGGTGSLIVALQAGCRVVAMPRRADQREHYDDHQLEIVEAFHKLGLVEVAHCQKSLAEAIARLESKPRQRVEMDGRALAEPVRRFLGMAPVSAAA